MKDYNCPFCECKLKIKKEMHRNDKEIVVLYCICNYYYHLTLVDKIFEEEAYTINYKNFKYKLHATNSNKYYTIDLLKIKIYFYLVWNKKFTLYFLLMKLRYLIK